MLNRYKLKIPETDIGKTYDDSCITVVSSNIRCKCSVDKKEKNWFYRGPLLVQTLIDANADIIGMQEVKKEPFRLITSALHGYGSVIEYRDKSRDPESCPILYNLSKFDCERKGSFWLSETPDRISKDWGAACYRICSYVVLNKKDDGKKFAVFNTHLDHISEEARIKSIRLTLKKLEEFGDMPCVIMGDFNTYEDSETYWSATEKLDNAKYRAKDSDSGATYQGWGQKLDDENIDYFLISKEGIDVLDYKVIRTDYDGVYPSDHFPIKIKINLI